ncbi:Arc family DNA-binding protein, partial [Klebsiella pneumoniae]
MSKFPSQEMDRFNVRLPVGMRDAIADRAKRNGRSMNSEIVQILQDALETEKLIAETDIVDFDSTQA